MEIKELMQKEHQTRIISELAQKDWGKSRFDLLILLKKEGWMQFEEWESSPVWVHPAWAQAYKEEGDDENIPDDCIWIEC